MKTVPEHISYVMDASALLAVALGEPHIDELPQLFTHSVISTCNLAESANIMVSKHGADPEISWDFFYNLIEHHYPINDDLSRLVVMMSALVKPYGLSLGDRYCLALTKYLNLPVYTGDKVWKQLERKLGVTVKLIR